MRARATQVRSEGAKPDPTTIEEAATLKRLYEERVSSDVSQERFGADFGIGTQGMVWQLLNGRRPLHLAAAIGFAKGLRVPVSAFSPRLYELATEAVTVNVAPPSVESLPADVREVVDALARMPADRKAVLWPVIRAAIGAAVPDKVVEQRFAETREKNRARKASGDAVKGSPVAAQQRRHELRRTRDGKR